MQEMYSNIFKRDIPLSAIIIAIAIVIASLMGFFAVKEARNAANSISSTGSAREKVVADTAKVSGEISTRVLASQIKSGYNKVASDKVIVEKYLLSQGVLAADIVAGAPYASEVWTGDSKGPREFDIKQTITVQSDNIELIKKVSDNFLSVINQDVSFQLYGVEYYYSKLADKRTELLGKAVIDAKNRANEIAKSSGGKVGTLMSARAGVVQVLAPNSQNIDNYGTYDTTTINKDVVVTVNATFRIK